MAGSRSPSESKLVGGELLPPPAPGPRALSQLVLMHRMAIAEMPWEQTLLPFDCVGGSVVSECFHQGARGPAGSHCTGSSNLAVSPFPLSSPSLPSPCRG